MTLTLHLPLPDLQLVQTVFRAVVAGAGVLVLLFRIWMENKQ